MASGQKFFILLNKDPFFAKINYVQKSLQYDTSQLHLKHFFTITET